MQRAMFLVQPYQSWLKTLSIKSSTGERLHVRIFQKRYFIENVSAMKRGIRKDFYYYFFLSMTK